MLQHAPLVPAGSSEHDWLWLIPALPLGAAALAGILHFLTLRARGQWKRAPGAHGHGHDAHGHDAHGHDAHGHDAHGHDAHAHDHAAHGDHPAKFAAGIGALAPWIAALSMYAAFALALKGFAALRALPETARVLRSTAWDWIDAGTFGIDVAMHLDPLSSVMTLVVTGIGALIFTYAAGYMKGDEGYAKFFSYLALFAFSMLMLVLSSSLIGLFVGWEGVGLCSYLLIGFWYQKTGPAEAGQKAFVMNRIGDASFLLGSFLLVQLFGSLDMAAIVAGVPGSMSAHATELFVAGLFLFGGACGKSAQIPLFTWLPDAMAGPTPVSALIHAATMVTAGVYLVVRLNPLFAASPTLLAIIGIVAAATAFLAGTTALVQRDIKRVLAYSTVSQLGYMFLGLASGAWAAAVFHLVTHAFFKALLFLGAGSVIHGMHEEQDMHRMGGLKRHMPATFLTFLAGAAALSGLPLLSGFFSKDEILAHTFAQGTPLSYALWGVGLLTAALTAFYTWRMVALTFFGKERFDVAKVHPHESPAVMTVPLMVLAVLSVVGGVLGLPVVLHAPHLLGEWLEPVTASGTKILRDAHGAHHMSLLTEWILLGVGAAVAIVFAVRGFKAYAGGIERDQQREARSPRLSAFLTDAWTVDTKYTSFVVGPVKLLAFVIAVVVDAFAIDGMVNGAAALTRGIAGRVRKMADGSVATYGLWMGAVTALMAFLFLWKH
jgi:NADH-quinone oxidoreductase subunit L